MYEVYRILIIGNHKNFVNYRECDWRYEVCVNIGMLQLRAERVFCNKIFDEHGR